MKVDLDFKRVDPEFFAESDVRAITIHISGQTFRLTETENGLQIMGIEPFCAPLRITPTSGNVIVARVQR